MARSAGLAGMNDPEDSGSIMKWKIVGPVRKRECQVPMQRETGNSKVSEKSGVKKGRVGDMRNTQASSLTFRRDAERGIAHSSRDWRKGW